MSDKKKYLELFLNLSVIGMFIALWISENTFASKLLWTSFWVMIIGVIEYYSILQKEEQHANKEAKSE